MTDEQRLMVVRACAGDKDALAELLELFGPEVEAVLGISPKWQGMIDAADVMQVTYLEAFAHIRDFDPARAESFPAWLGRMAENNLRDAIRALEAKKNPPPHLKLDAYGADHGLALFDVLTSGGETPSRIVRKDEARERLAQALRCLPPDYARTIQLYDLEGHPVEDVAAQLGRSTGAVFMLRMRAHDRLRELLGRASQILESRS
ncbi:MAG TPA: sigma-70 family RNA polymerase sigma factor [Phycisphaerae bacterium]|nr:sigma-70 family RNA polymerase sigma factor [Phycisphaerae bacterium]